MRIEKNKDRLDHNKKSEGVNVISLDSIFHSVAVILVIMFSKYIYNICLSKLNPYFNIYSHIYVYLIKTCPLGTMVTW